MVYKCSDGVFLYFGCESLCRNREQNSILQDTYRIAAMVAIYGDAYCQCGMVSAGNFL